jgi:hypothetical protein
VRQSKIRIRVGERLRISEGKRERLGLRTKSEDKELCLVLNDELLRGDHIVGFYLRN